MDESRQATIWLVCPKCRSRRAVAAQKINERRLCAQCSTELTAAHATISEDPGIDLAASAAATESAAAPTSRESEDDEIRIAPPPPRLELLRSVLPPPPALDAAPETWVAPPTNASLGWAFFSGVFGFPFWPNAFGKWIFLSVTLAIADAAFVFCATAFAMGGYFGIVAAGTIAIAAFFIGIFALSYAAACVTDITINTAYNADEEEQWPDNDWRERLFHLVRVGYFLASSMVLAAGIAGLGSLADSRLWWIMPVATIILFPIVFLSALEADSIWPISGPVWSSLAGNFFAWLVFYLLSLALTTVLSVAGIISLRALGVLSSLVEAPLTAAAIFIYGRLLGRLAWLIMHAQGRDSAMHERYGRQKALQARAQKIQSSKPPTTPPPRGRPR
jgi:hypothetical protein